MAWLRVCDATGRKEPAHVGVHPLPQRQCPAAPFLLWAGGTASFAAVRANWRACNHNLAGSAYQVPSLNWAPQRKLAFSACASPSFLCI